MTLKLLPLLILIFIECHCNEFSVVSTSEPPNEHDNRITNIEAKISDFDNKLQTIEGEILHLLDKETDHDTKIETNIKNLNRRLQTLEEQNTKLFQQNSALALKQFSPIFPPKNCQEVKKRGHTISSIYFIRPSVQSDSIKVYCDMESMGGGWTYILKRYKGSENFARNWTDYKKGFGNPSEEYWLGLDNIHYLTGFEVNELLINLTDWDDKQVYAHYTQFSVNNENNGYLLNSVSGYSGTAGDSLSQNEGKMFSSADKDLDFNIANCAAYYGGAGWWYGSCMHSLLTGKYYKENVTKVPEGTGMMWQTFHGYLYSLKVASMMVRLKDK